MNMAMEQFLEQAISLPPRQRVELAETLLASVSSSDAAAEEFTLAAETGEAWGIEIRKRVAEIEENRVELIPGDHAIPGRSENG